MNDFILEQRGWLGMFARIFVILFAPIWLPVLLLLYVLLTAFIHFPYFLWTGKDL